MERIATVVQCKLGETIYLQDSAAEYWYRVKGGAARKLAHLANGHRQIVDFLVPGDLFGFGNRNRHHHFSVEAIVEGTTVARYPRRAIERLAETDPEVGRAIRESAFASIARLQTRMVLLGRTSAYERVCAFLLEMADRSRTAPSNAVTLPMSRHDIADYLAITVETLSRTLSELRRRGAITLDGARCVQIVRRAALDEGNEEASPGQCRLPGAGDSREYCVSGVP
jgi:CRP/FNR family nitrogen fixation transcriptional regulator